MKKITLTLFALLVTLSMWQVNAQTIPGSTGGVPDSNCPIDTPFTAPSTLTGSIGTDYEIVNVTIDISHTFDGDLEIKLQSPSGTIHNLAINEGGSGDNFTSTVFQDGAPSITTGSAPYTGVFEAEGGPFAISFDGDNVNGDWILQICDSAGGDVGTLNSWSITFNSLGASAFTECGVPLGQPIPAVGTSGPMTPSVATVGTVGTVGVDYSIDFVDLDLNHTFDSDLDITLQSPGGLTLDLSSDNGGGGDNYTATVFQDGNPNITTGSAPFTGTFEPEGGTLNGTFAGEPVNGDWTLLINDDTGGDTGFLNNYCITFAPIGVIGDPPVIACPVDVSVDTDPGVCEAVVNFADAVAIDTEDGPIATIQTMGPASGSAFPTGDTIIEYSVTDSDNNTVTCQFTITVTDNENPVAICQDITVTLDAMGMATITPADLDAGSTDNCTGSTVTIGQTTFGCSDVGATIVTLTITDLAGNVDTCDATVTVVDDIAPVIACIGEPSTIIGSSMESPNVPIISNAGPVVSTMTVTDNFNIVDLDVNLDITHTWTGDLTITLESPAGTVVTIFDGGADGCSGDDITTLLDDESANALNCQAGTPDAFPETDYIPSNPLAAFDGESTMGDWILSVDDTVGGDDGNLNSWSILYSHDVTGSPLEVDLDAMGMVTINASDLIMNVDEACGYTVTIGGGGAPMPATLATTFAGGNGFAGNMFDIMAINDLTVDSFDINLGTGVTDNIEVWYRMGSFVGFEGSNAGWTLLDTAAGITSNGNGVATPLNLNLGQVVTAGSTVAFYVTTTLGGQINYTNGGTLGDLFASDANLEFYEGNGGGYFAVNFSPRVFNGNILYSTGGGSGTTIDFDCSNLGENLIEVTVTDASGNESTCMATVNVNDVTAPVITCVGPTSPTETGTVSDAPAMVIDDNTTQSTTITVTDNFPITDLNVDLDITHSWTGDLQITLESPAGTQVLIFDGGADGCASDDFVGVTLDDESANALFCDAGPAFTGDYMPSNALAAFDGESTVGDWILSIEDTVGGDDGVLNTWGITYSYDGVPTVAFPIELDENGEATIDPLDLIASTDEACGIDVVAADITDFTCADIGTIIDVTVFVSDASGNIAACVAQVMVVDLLAPVLTCPADQNQDPGPGNLFWEVPDYFANGEATATDNCTDPVVITTQDPAAGTLLSDGVYTVTITAEDDYGNLSTCDFELTIESILGAQDNELNNAIAIFPNPANDQFTISNSSNIVLDNAMIYDINGKLVSQINLQDMQSEKVVNIADYATGVYMVYITGEQSSVVKRLIKE